MHGVRCITCENITAVCLAVAVQSYVESVLVEYTISHETHPQHSLSYFNGHQVECKQLKSKLSPQAHKGTQTATIAVPAQMVSP
jgi:hypothetical protein